MKAITLWQPHASLVAIGAKRVETRSWSTSYRGPVAIHASKRMPDWARELCFDEPFFSALERAGDWVPDADLPTTTKLNLPFGAIVAAAELWDCRHISGIAGKDWLPLDAQELAFGDYSPGRWMWFLCRVRPLPEPIPCRGAQGLWTLPAEVEAAVKQAA